MSLCTQLMRSTRQCPSILRRFSVAAEALQIPVEQVQAFRTLEANPAKHNTDHLHRFYTLSPETRQTLYRYGGLPKKFATQTETFLECAFLVRSPAVEIISLLNRTDYTRAANRYVIYGEIGTGKSIILAHLLHYAFVTKKIIVHVPWVPTWFQYPKEVATSLTKEGYFDLPVDGAAWLIHFKHQNSQLLAELNLTVSKDYEWSIRESTKAGAPLLELIDLGISRIKYSCNIVCTLIEELKIASTAGKCSTLVAIDGFNAFYAETCNIKNDDKKRIKPVNVTLTDAFLNATKFDWCNAAVVVTVDTLATMRSYTDTMKGEPLYLLGKDGFEHFDPFLPVKVENYTAEEFEAVMEYYKDRKWIRNITKEGQRELEMLTVRNPYNLMRRTACV